MEQEATEMIDKAKRLTEGINNPLCTLHTEMLVWMIRRMLEPQPGWKTLVSNLPTPAAVIVGVVYLVLLGFKVVPPPFTP